LPQWRTDVPARKGCDVSERVRPSELDRLVLRRGLTTDDPVLRRRREPGRDGAWTALPRQPAGQPERDRTVGAWYPRSRDGSRVRYLWEEAVVRQVGDLLAQADQPEVGSERPARARARRRDSSPDP